MQNENVIIESSVAPVSPVKPNRREGWVIVCITPPLRCVMHCSSLTRTHEKKQTTKNQKLLALYARQE